MSHRESSPLRRPFQRQSITVPGTQTSVCSSKSFLASLRRRCSLASALLRRLTSPRRSGDRAKVANTPTPSILPQHLHDLRVCEFSLVNLGVRDARAVNSRMGHQPSVSERGSPYQLHPSRARAPSLSSPDGESGKTNTSTIVSARHRAVRVRALTRRRCRLMLIEISGQLRNRQSWT